MTRREWLKMTAAMGGALALPNVTGVLGSQRGPALPAQAAPAIGRERLLADFGWRFRLGHANDPALDFGYGRGNAFAKSGSFIPGGGRGNPGIAQAAFDDSQWTAVDLPHDWAIDLPFISDRGANAHGAKPLGRTFPETSIGWYRRTFDIPAADLGRRMALEFDGVFRDAIVVLNGHYIGRNLSGYAPFRFDVTDFITYGGRNVLVVRADATESEGWFYEGAGIYRHVWLEKTAPVHVAHWGTFVTSDVKPGTAVAPFGSNATVTMQADVTNDSADAVTCHVVSRIVDGDGKTVATATSAPLLIGAWQAHTFRQQAAIARPSLWSVDQPHLYRLETTVATASGPIDRYDTPFGIRTVRFDADRGLLLNEMPVKIKGMCNHQDHAGVGSGLPDRLQGFRIERLKAMPVSLPLTSGIASPTALAAPVVEGMMLIAAVRPPFQSFFDGPSTVFCVAV